MTTGIPTFAAFAGSAALRVRGGHGDRDDPARLAARWSRHLPEGVANDYATRQGTILECRVEMRREDCAGLIARAGSAGDLPVAADAAVIFATFADLVVAQDLKAPGMARLCAIKRTEPGDGRRSVPDFVTLLGGEYVDPTPHGPRSRLDATWGGEALRDGLADLACALTARIESAVGIRLWTGLGDGREARVLVRTADGGVEDPEGDVALACAAFVAAHEPVGWSTRAVPDAPSNRWASWHAQPLAIDRPVAVAPPSALLRVRWAAGRRQAERQALGRLLANLEERVSGHPGTDVVRRWGEGIGETPGRARG